MSVVLLPITLATAGAAALLNLWLAARTGRARGAAKVSIGDGGDPVLLRRMRAHANYGENAPLILILIALIEFTAGTSTWLWAASAAFLLARIAHALGMEGLRGARSGGIAVTFALMAGLALYAIMLPFAADRPLPRHVGTQTPAG